MSDWQKDLEKKATELNLKKEVANVQFRSSSGSDNRDSSGRIGSIRLFISNKEINNKNSKKGGKGMIGIEGALSDVDDVVSKGIYKDRETKTEIKLNTDLEKIGAIVKILLKFLSTIRSNQLLTEQDKVEIKKKKAERPVK